MGDSKRVFSVFIIFILLLGLPTEMSSNHLEISKSNNVTPADVEFTQVISDPDLDTEPEAFVNGSSGEFSYSYTPGIMQLNWTHERDTLLDNSSSNGLTYPAYHDFVYFTQSFDWLHDEMPVAAELFLNYSVSKSGGLASEDVADMFRLYAWFIDSSGNWWSIYNPLYFLNSWFYERSKILSDYDIRQGFQGMIDDSSGVQEDPEDTLTLGVGLAPSHLFNNSVNDGTVIVEVSSVKLHVITEIEPDPATHLNPLYNESIETTVSDLLPGFAGDKTYTFQFLEAMTKDPDGNLYLTGYTSIPYDFVIEHDVWSIRQFLIKYNPVLNQSWLVRNDNRSRAYAITYHNGNIFTSGWFYGKDAPEYGDLMLTKWSSTGQKIWEKKRGGDFDQIGVALDVHSDGSIYVMMSDFNMVAEGPYQNSSLLKYDSAGNLLWEKPLPECTFLDIAGELWVLDSHIVYFISGIIMCMDLDGNVLWQETASAATCDDSGSIYAMTEPSTNIEISHYNLEGNQTWTSDFYITYPNDWSEWLYPKNLALTPNNELLALVEGITYDESYHLVKYDINGTHLQTWSIGNERWPPRGGPAPLMEVTSTGLAYFSFHPLGPAIFTQAYVIGGYTIPNLTPPSLDAVTIAAMGGGIGVIALVGLWIYRKKKA